jgi:wyosine [tRNA(Phe)-imidazoG37] synthetase (radical SAM superfamily)
MPDPAPRHVFGPVPSRRLGRSLGIDLVPHKTCPFDCLYCQVGRTTDHTLRRREFVPLDAVLAEIGERLRAAADDPPDTITFSGSGEPTLYSRAGELIDGIHALTDIPVTVLTNGALFPDPAVRAEIARADRVVPSLDAPDEATFLRVNRPAPGLGFDALAAGLVAFREDFRGELWLEVFLLRGLTDDEATVRAMADVARRIRPERVQLNTVHRPPAEDAARAVPRDELERYAELFTPRAEVIAPYRSERLEREHGLDPEAVLALLRRRPCTAEDVAAGLGLHPLEAGKLLELLVAEGAARRRAEAGAVFYDASAPGSA